MTSSLRSRNLILRSSPQRPRHSHSRRQAENPALGQLGTKNSYVPKYFTADEWRFLNAAVERLIPRTTRARRC